MCFTFSRIRMRLICWDVGDTYMALGRSANRQLDSNIILRNNLCSKISGVCLQDFPTVLCSLLQSC